MRKDEGIKIWDDPDDLDEDEDSDDEDLDDDELEDDELEDHAIQAKAIKDYKTMSNLKSTKKDASGKQMKGKDDKSIKKVSMSDLTADDRKKCGQYPRYMTAYAILCGTVNGRTAFSHSYDHKHLASVLAANGIATEKLKQIYQLEDSYMNGVKHDKLV